MTIADGQAQAKIDTVIYKADHGMRQRLEDALNDRFLGVQLLTPDRLRSVPSSLCSSAALIAGVRRLSSAPVSVVNSSVPWRIVMQIKLTAVFRSVPEGYIGFVEELPGANTQGATLEEARTNLQEALMLVLEANRTLAEESLRGQEVIREPLAITAA